jgi:hypothetical protein
MLKSLIDWLNHRNDRDMKAYTALKHKKAWSLYDTKVEEYRSQTNKPTKSPEANQSC